jgi:hypothetical protein
VESLGYLWIPVGFVLAIIVSELIKAIVKLTVDGVNRSIKLDDKINQLIEANNAKRSVPTATQVDSEANSQATTDEPAANAEIMPNGKVLTSNSV